MDTKRCTKCGEVKPLAEFTKDKSKRDGHSPWCKVCERAAVAARRKANPEKRRAREAAWRAANPEKRRARHLAGRERVARGYAAQILGVPAADLTPELYEAYREYLLTKRATKALNEALKGKTNVE